MMIAGNLRVKGGQFGTVKTTKSLGKAIRALVGAGVREAEAEPGQMADCVLSTA